jgi:outer membrane protein
MEELIEMPEAPQETPVVDQEKKPKFKLIYVALGVNVLLIAGFIMLFLMFRSYKNEHYASVKAQAAANYHREGGLKVAFVNSDSIKSQYQLVKDLQKSLQEKYAKLDGDMTSKQKELEGRANELQKKFEAKQISLEEAQRADNQLKEEGKRLYDLNQEYSSRLSQEEGKMNRVFVDSIDNFLKRYNKKFRFDYILGYSRGGGLLFANDTLDITKDVLNGLNREYTEKNPHK